MATSGTDNSLTLAARLEAALRLLAEDPDAAETEADNILGENPGSPPALRVRALIARHRGDEAGGARFDRDAIEASLRQPAMASARQAFLDDRIEEAEQLVRQHLRGDPEDPAAALLLGRIAAKCNARREAETLFRRAIVLAPAYADARMAVARLLRESGRNDEVIAALEELLTHEPDHLDALALLAGTHAMLRRFDEADAVFERLHAAHPGDARGWMNHAYALKTVGRQDDAIAAYRRSLALDPGNAVAWLGLANLKTVRLSAGDIAAMGAALDDADLDLDTRIDLLFALGKALDDAGDPAAAFARFSEGARMRLENVPHDPGKVWANVAKVAATCTGEFYQGRRDWGAAASDPIFIVSLPRSGSTLVEQILASHPMIEGTEELFDLEHLALGLAPGEPAGSWLDRLGSLNREKVKSLGWDYIKSTRRFRHTDRTLFTDKMPSNWMFIGLIHLILPDAKIIDIRRHPLGCGFANFSQHFNWGINFSYDLAHIGEFYSAYVRQMAHFERVLPGRVHHLTYEGLIEDTEAEVRRLLEYVGVPFDPACLRFFETERAVHTPSSEQVRSPINRDGLERWKRYEQWLGPLKDALGPVLAHYPDVPPEYR